MSKSVPHDPTIPFLSRALDTGQAQRALEDLMPGAAVRAAYLLRHKPGRRCLIEYEVETSHGPMSMMGKVRAKGLDTASFDTLRACWRSGLPVAEPVGVIPEFKMWLQRKLPGEVATTLIVGHRGTELAGKIAETMHELHQSSIPARRRHTIDDELAILHTRLSTLAQDEPRWASRLNRILQACGRISAGVAHRQNCGIHRDFYPDQVIVDGSRLYLVDLDLYAVGDPALDIGNFIGHLIEYGVRHYRDRDALQAQKHALLERYVELSDESVRHAIHVYTTLTLARHIHLSTRFPDRRHTTECLIDLCEELLGATAFRT